MFDQTFSLEKQNTTKTCLVGIKFCAHPGNNKLDPSNDFCEIYKLRVNQSGEFLDIITNTQC